MTALRTDVSALYVDPRGPYPKLLADCWDESRDARLYAGPNPVVAHPPCGPWGNLRQLTVPGRKRRDESSCAAPSVVATRRWGGVLEQPAGSILFREFGLPSPGDGPDAHGGWSYEVAQVAWGHVARKKTWLYVVGAPVAVVVAGIRSGGTPTHWVSGGRKHRRNGAGGFVPPGIKVCSAQQRRRTPLPFAEWLIDLASRARPA